MDEKILKEMENLDQLILLENGMRGVPVVLQYKPRLHHQPRADRKTFLTNEFKAVQNQIGTSGVRIDLETVSPSGQLVQAIVPVDQLANVEKELKTRNIEMQPDRMQKIV